MDTVYSRGRTWSKEVHRGNDRWEIISDIRLTHSANGAVLLDVRKGLCYRLNVVAARIWVTIEASQTGIGIAGIADALETHFDVSRQKLESDITEYLNELESIGVVERKNNNLSSRTTAGGI